jgi:hypothetical protein
MALLQVENNGWITLHDLVSIIYVYIVNWM